MNQLSALENILCVNEGWIEEANGKQLRFNEKQVGF
jgi:hypothetical protein